MTIAGSDSSAGAGIQADLKTFAAMGVYGTSVVTAITAQNTQGVYRVQEMPPDLVAAQIDAVLSDIRAEVVKTGMLASADIVEVVVDKVRQYSLASLVVDPVLRANSGEALLSEKALAMLREHLLPLALVVTPNLDEAAALTNQEVQDSGQMREAAARMAAMGARNVVITGGHLEGTAIDLLFDGREYHELSAPRVDTTNTHGTGCTFASAIAASLAKGLEVRQAVATAKAFVTKALQQSFPVGKGTGPVHHFFRYWQDTLH
jgi:hydroxymethylpyrimidine/phosphomethylpyrimidine kinase